MDYVASIQLRTFLLNLAISRRMVCENRPSPKRKIDSSSRCAQRFKNFIYSIERLKVQRNAGTTNRE